MKANDVPTPRNPAPELQEGQRAWGVSHGLSQADARTRTGDPFITSEVLYQLSYVGEAASLAALQVPLVRRQAAFQANVSSWAPEPDPRAAQRPGGLRWSFTLPQRFSPNAVAAPHAADHPACGRVYGRMSGAARGGATSRSDGLHWPHGDGLKWPHPPSGFLSFVS